VVRSEASSAYIRGAVYLASDSSFVDSTYELEITTSGDSWAGMEFVNGNAVSNSTEYFLIIWGNDAGGTFSCYYDLTCTEETLVRNNYTYSGNPWPATFSQNYVATSFCAIIYATYTTGGGGGRIAPFIH
jgi:hypothetical protein